MSFVPYAYSFSAPGVSPPQLSLFAPSFRPLSSSSSPSSSSPSSSTISVVHRYQTTTSGLIRPSPPPPPLPPVAPRPRVASSVSSPDAVAPPPSSTMFGPNLLHAYPRIAALHESMCPPTNALSASATYPGSGAGQGFSPFASNNGESVDAWRTISGHVTSPNGWSSFDPTAIVGFPYSATYGGLDVRRKNATRESTSTLKAWLYEHIKNPYPTKGEKIMLAIITKMTLTQVSTWFANARRRLKKENKMQWSPRNRAGDDDDDDDDKNSDNDDDAGSGNALTQNDDNDEDEDIVVDSGNDDSYQLSPHCFNGDEFLRESGVRSNRIESTGTGSHSPAISDTERKDNNPSSRGNTPGHEGASRAGCSVTSSSFFAASTAISTLGATTSTVATSATIRPSDKPRIWSLADVATSNTSHGNGRRSNPTAQSLSGPPPLAPIMTSVTCPTSTCGSSGHRSFQPWMHTSSSSSSSPSSGNSPLTAYGNSHWQQDAMNAGHQLDIGAVSCGAAVADIVGTGVRSFGMGSRRSDNSTPEHSLASDSIPLQRLSNGAISD